MDVLRILETIENSEDLAKAGNVFPLNPHNQKTLVNFGLRSAAHKEETRKRGSVDDNSQKRYRIGTETRTTEDWVPNPYGCLTLLMRMKGNENAFFSASANKRLELAELLGTAMAYYNCRSFDDLVSKLKSLIDSGLERFDG